MVDWANLIVDDGSGTTTLLDHLKVHLGVTDGSRDVELSLALAQAGTIAERYVDRVLAKQTVEEFYPHHFGTVILHEPQVDTQSPVTVLLDGTTQTDYKVYLGRGRLGHLSRTGVRPDMPMDWRGYEQVQIQYTAGYDPLPLDLADALTYIAADYSTTPGTGAPPGGGGSSGEIKSMSIYDVGSISYDVGSSSSSTGGSGTFGSGGPIPDTAMEMLTRYKRMAA